MMVGRSELPLALEQAEERVRSEGDWLVSDLDVLLAVVQRCTAVREVLAFATVNLVSVEQRLESMTSRGAAINAMKRSQWLMSEPSEIF